MPHDYVIKLPKNPESNSGTETRFSTGRYAHIQNIENLRVQNILFLIWMVHICVQGVCGMWDRCAEEALEDYKEIYKYGISDICVGGIETSWGERTEKYMEPLDNVGYNYLYGRFEHNKIKYPKRVIWGSETHAFKFFESWQATINNSNEGKEKL